MNYFNNKLFIFIRYARIISYTIFFLFFILVPTSYFIEQKSICFYFNHFELLCPSCGITRAFSYFMHFDFKNAFNFNPVFTIAIGPIFIFLFLEDLITIIINIISKKEKYSIIEYIILRYL